jgi:hypothetical protein
MRERRGNSGLRFFAFVERWLTAALTVTFARPGAALIGIRRRLVTPPNRLELLLFLPIFLKVLVIFDAAMRPSGAHGFFCSRCNNDTTTEHPAMVLTFENHCTYHNI